MTIERGELVRISIAAANRRLRGVRQPGCLRSPASQPAPPHLAFAQGPQGCLGVHLARLEAWLALDALVKGRRAAPCPRQHAASRGAVFRKPAALHVLWGQRLDPAGQGSVTDSAFSWRRPINTNMQLRALRQGEAWLPGTGRGRAALRPPAHPHPRSGRVRERGS